MSSRPAPQPSSGRRASSAQALTPPPQWSLIEEQVNSRKRRQPYSRPQGLSASCGALKLPVAATAGHFSTGSGNTLHILNMSLTSVESGRMRRGTPAFIAF